MSKRLGLREKLKLRPVITKRSRNRPKQWFQSPQPNLANGCDCEYGCCCSLCFLFLFDLFYDRVIEVLNRGVLYPVVLVAYGTADGIFENDPCLVTANAGVNIFHGVPPSECSDGWNSLYEYEKDLMRDIPS